MKKRRDPERRPPRLKTELPYLNGRQAHIVYGYKDGALTYLIINGESYEPRLMSGFTWNHLAMAGPP